MHTFPQRSFPGLIVSMNILERAPTAPSDVPTLEETTALLEEIVNGRSAVVSVADSGNTTYMCIPSIMSTSLRYWNGLLNRGHQLCSDV